VCVYRLVRMLSCAGHIKVKEAEIVTNDHYQMTDLVTKLLI